MWTRKTTDPLGKLLFDKYGMHVLARPRENVAVFDVFGVRGGETFRSGGIDGFLHAALDKPEVARDEALVDVEAQASDAVAVDMGLTFLQGFLALFGVGAVQGVSASLARSDSRALRLRFGGCTRDHVTDGFELDWKLSEHRFVRENSAMKEGCRYYIATAVHYCRALSFEALDKDLARLDLSADVAALGEAKAGLVVSNDRQITARSDRKLAYGVELNEIVHDAKRKRLQLMESGGYVHVKADVAAPLPKAMIGAPDGSMMLSLVD